MMAALRASRFVYKRLAKPFFFAQDPEKVHNSMISAGALLGSNPITRAATSLALEYQNPMLRQNLMGIRFRNPVGLSAGFDKDGKASMIMKSVGFGFAEVGSVTAKPCPGNPGIRLTRLPEQKSILVNLGLNNLGAVKIHKRLLNQRSGIPRIVSVAKTNCRETTDPVKGLADYLYTISMMREVADCFELNISCPNAYGGQDFADPKLFERLAAAVEMMKLSQPVLVKMSPDLTRRNIDLIVKSAAKHGIAGFVCTNLTKHHGYETGGLSGKAVQSKANDLLAYMYRKNLQHDKRFILIGAGGIFSAEDAYAKIKLGANLVELITGMIYNGPQLIGEINYGLCQLLKKDGYANIGQAVGDLHHRGKMSGLKTLVTQK
jgi:dihydroorotate dehydrogenase subfamily 2